MFLLGALAILAIGWRDSGLLAGAFSGFVLLAPVLVTGFHELSRRLETGASPPRLGVLALSAPGRRRGSQLALFGVILALIGTAWVAFSSLLVRLSIGPAASGASGVAGFLRELTQASDGWAFVWLLAGGLLAAIVFAISAISVPMLVDREVPLSRAIRASVAATGANPLAMASWAALIMLLTLAACVTLVGLVVVVPVLGHASWHAYRDLVGRVADPGAVEIPGADPRARAGGR